MNTATLIDSYALAGTMKRFLPLLVVSGIICGVVFTPSMAAGLIGSALISGAMVISAGSEDSAAWESFRASLPLSRRQIVDGHYVAMLLFALILFALVLAASWLALVCQWQLDGGPGTPGDATDVLLELGDVATTYFLMTIVACAILPVLMRYGMAGSLRFIVLGACAFVICVGVAFGEDIPNTAALPEWLEAIPASLVALAVAACAWVASYFVARAWYVRKEF